MPSETETARKTPHRASPATNETDEQAWERTQREQADKAREASEKDAEKRAGMNPQDLAVDDRRRAHAATADARGFVGLTQDEKNKELDKSEPIPPWQTRLPSGKVFDARTQTPIVLVATNGTSLDGADNQVAREFYFKDLSRED